MFFKQVWRNASKSRRNNGLFFASLVIAIVAFYTLLSLGDQDVMLFLKTVESDAVNRLLLIVPMVYAVSLFFVFFLVYFAYGYQLDSRKKEFGLYLMMGMKRGKLFAMLLCETLWNSLRSVLLGLPVALFLTEAISLATAKLVGLGIVGHKISFSIPAVLGTVIGFVFVQLIAMVVLSFYFIGREPMQLLQTDAPQRQGAVSKKKGWLCFVLGILFLTGAYAVGVLLLRSFDIKAVALILVLGGSGTFLLYRGMGVFIGHRISQKSPSQSGLFTFTGRQIQENVLSQHKALAISSLLLLMALACVSFGSGTAFGRGAANARSVDFSIEGSQQEIADFLNREENRQLVETAYPMYLGTIDTEIHTFAWELGTALETQPKTALRDNMIENFSHRAEYPYIISQTSYNHVLRSLGKEPLLLDQYQAAVYTSMGEPRDFTDILSGALAAGGSVQIDNQRYELTANLCYDNIVADRKIAFYSALILPDEAYQSLSDDGGRAFCHNVLLSRDAVRQNGLMQAIGSMGEKLSAAGLEYESYLGGIGRNLFFTVAASYLTIYLGVLFMLIANTVIGLKFLIQQRTNKRRYLTLLMLGATTDGLCRSAGKQIRLFFGLVFGVAACSSVFAVWAMFTSFLKLPAGASAGKVVAVTGIGFLLLLFIELIYIFIVQRASSREIRALRIDRR